MSAHSRLPRIFVPLALFAFTTFALAAGPFTIEQVMDSPFPDHLIAAKQGERVAWTADLRGVRNVFVADGPEFTPRPITHYAADDGRPLASLRLTPDGQYAVYARGSEQNEKGEVADPDHDVQQPKQQVWSVKVAGGTPQLLGELGCDQEDCEDIEISPDGQFAVWAARKQIWIAPISGATPAHALTYARGDNQAPRWSPDGKHIAFVSDRGDHSLVAIYDFERQSLHYMEPSVDRDVMPRWSKDGTQIAFVRLPGIERKRPIIPIRQVPWAIWVGDAATGRAREIWHSTSEPNGSFPDNTADVSFHVVGDRVLFASEQDGWNHLYSIPLAGGTATLLTPGEFEVEDVTIPTDERSVLYSSNQGDIERRHIWRVGITGGLPQALTSGETLEWKPVETGDGKFVLVLGSTATTPAMPYLLAAKGRQMLGQIPADFPANELVVPKLVTFKSEDGLTIHGQLFVPRGRTAPGPALIFTHGGPVRQMLPGFHYMDYYHNAYAMNQYLASQGYVVLSVNYRLGIMYGRAFREAPNTVWRGAAEYKDVVAGARYLQSLPIVDPQKVGLWGGSYGGFLTAMGLARNSDIFKAGVDFHGVHDWSEFLSDWNGPGTAKAPDYAEAEKMAFQSSPEGSMATWKSPVLLIQGDDDRNVPFSETVDLAQRLRDHSVPFEQLVFPDEIHGFLMWKSWIRAYSATANFFDRTLKEGQKIGEGTVLDPAQ